MRKLERLFNLKLIKSFIICAKPFWQPILIIILIQSSLSVTSIGTVIASRRMIDLSVSKNFSKAIFFLIIVAVLYLLNIVSGALVNLISVRLNEKMANSMQRSIITRLYKTEWLPFNKYHSGDILTRLTSDVTNIVNFWVTIFPGILGLVVQLILAFMTLFYFDKTLAVFAFILGPVTIVISFFMGRRLKKMQHKIQTAESRCRSKIQESIQNMLIIKAFNIENKSIKQITENQNEKYNWVVKKSNISILAGITLGSGYWLGYFAAFSWGAYKLSIGLTSFGTFTAFIQLVGQVQGPFSGLSRTLPQFVTSLASVERIMELEALELENIGDSAPLFSENITKIIINNVSFSYKKEKPMISKVSFNLKVGEIAALIGVSGEGKTTMMRLLLSLIKPDSGDITFLLDTGEKVKLTSETRSCFTYVPQGNTLFSGSIVENLYIGKEDATLEELESALKTACAWDFVQELPEKLNTVIGESGLGLSEGQAQRLTIARALLKQSKILLLDEATSALDLETEKAVLSNIRNLRPKKTCIAITHRLSVIDICDRVFRISENRFEEVEFNKPFTVKKEDNSIGYRQIKNSIQSNSNIPLESVG